jgi:hypothetical protein
VALAFAWIAAFVSLTVIGWAVLGGVRLYQKFAGARSTEPVPREPIEQLGANLCRLHGKLEAAENDMSAPFKAARLRALRGAYLDVLSAACERLEVPPPAAHSDTAVPLAEVYRAEAALRERGLDVRWPARRERPRPHQRPALSRSA